MSQKSKMPTSAQAAAVRTMVQEGESLDKIKDQFPDLADGVKVVEKERSKPAARGSGPAKRSSLRRPQL